MVRGEPRTQFNQATAYKQQHQEDGQNKSNQRRRKKDKGAIVGADTQAAQQRHRQKNKRQHPIGYERLIPRSVGSEQ